MKNFIQRAITGLIFVAVLIGCMIGGPLSFGVLFCIISALATAEFCIRHKPVSSFHTLLLLSI